MFQNALKSIPVENLRHYKDGTILAQVLKHLHKKEITTIDRDNEYFTDKIFM